jgi:hypothetical protein
MPSVFIMASRCWFVNVQMSNMCWIAGIPSMGTGAAIFFPMKGIEFSCSHISICYEQLSRFTLTIAAAWPLPLVVMLVSLRTTMGLSWAPGCFWTRLIGPVLSFVFRHDIATGNQLRVFVSSSCSVNSLTGFISRSFLVRFACVHSSSHLGLIN